MPRCSGRSRGEPPLLLLDEIAAHLDAGRRAALFEALLRLDSQAWLTGTDEALFAPLRHQVQFLSVHDGNLGRRPLLTRKPSIRTKWRTSQHPIPMAP